MTKATSTHVALLRSINVGGKNKLPMKDLVAIFGDAGCCSVLTYIQSGNVVFQANSSLARRIPELVADAIDSSFGYRVPILVRSAAALGQVVAENPFIRSGADGKTLHVAFLAERPQAARSAALDPHRSAPDEFVLRKREIYLYCPNGYGKTKLTNSYFDKTLGTTSTVRNWRTVLKLLEMADG